MCMILTLLTGEYKIIMTLISNKNHPFNLQEDYFSCTVIFKKVLDKENYVVLFTPKPRHCKIKRKGAPCPTTSFLDRMFLHGAALHLSL